MYSSGSSKGSDGQWSAPQTLQLLPGELVLLDPSSEQLSGRLPLEKMVVSTDERSRSCFTVRTAATGICLVIDADSGEPRKDLFPSELECVNVSGQPAGNALILFNCEMRYLSV